MIFLPVFAFTSAYYTDYHVMKRNIFQVFLLAVPGIVVVGIFLAVIFKYMLGYDFNWAECLLIGAILAETDPVAVSCLLEDIGVSEGISFVVDGESLLNDATAIVFFMVMEGFVKEEATSVGDVIGLLAKLTLGSGCVGLGFALIMWFWMRRLADDPIEVTTLTLLGSYLLFVICEGQELDMSGILSICSFGYFLCGYSEA
jgi:NhaP-type Na+/H+ or K+/H+ antiporter